MFFDLLLNGFAWVNCFPHWLDLGVVASLHVDLLALAAALDIEEHLVTTRVLFSHGAEESAISTRA